MASKNEYPHLAATGKELGNRTGLSLPQLRALLCGDCDFFDEQHEDDLECSCFMMLRVLLEKQVLTPECLARAVTGKGSGGD